MKRLLKISLYLYMGALLVYVSALHGQTLLQKTVVSAGGGRMQTDSLTIIGTLGQSATGSVSGGSYRMSGGFWTVGASEMTLVPEVTVYRDTLAFGYVAVHDSASLYLVVRNDGTATLEIPLIESLNPVFPIGEYSSSVTAGDSLLLRVTYKPQNPIATTSTITILCNDSDEPEIQVLLTGTGTDGGIVITPGILSAPAALQVYDAPADTGGLVQFRFVASPHHPGASGTLDDSDPITVYEVLASGTTDSTTAELLGDISVSGITPTEGDTVEFYFPVSSSDWQYYWIRAATDTRRSGLIGPNIGRALNNTRAATGDLNGNGEVDIWDVAVVAKIFGISDEYDPVIDLNNNGEIDIWDVAEIAKHFGETIP
jgi:hypothetical protein